MKTGTFFSWATVVIVTVTVVVMLSNFYNQTIDGVFINKPITFQVDTQALKTDKTAYHRGDEVSVLFSYCIHRGYRASATWRLIDDTVITFPEKDVVATPGCKTNVLVPIGQIPPYAYLGTHHVTDSVAITLNAAHTIYYEFKSADFQVQP